MLPAPPLPAQPVHCRLQDGNNLSGPVPATWASHPGLESVYVAPGNEGLCLPSGVDFPFRCVRVGHMLGGFLKAACCCC